MPWEMEILSPASYVSSSNWFSEESSSRSRSRRSTKWTPAENKMFENALAVYDKDTPDRWHKVAAMIPGKTVVDVKKQYKELEDDVNSIEAGLLPIPGYGYGYGDGDGDGYGSPSTSPFTLEWGNDYGFKPPGGKRPSSARPSDQERKKGIPWTEEEHKLFLLGLKKYGKGDWRNISRNFVITRTPTQVASHAQKYFIRQLSGGKDKRRASIHDITTVNLNDNRTPSPPNNKRHPSPDQSSALIQQPNCGYMPRSKFQWNQPNSGAAMAFNPALGNMIISPYGMNSYQLKMHAQNMQRSDMHEAYVGPQNMVFHMQSAHHYPHG